MLYLLRIVFGYRRYNVHLTFANNYPSIVFTIWALDEEDCYRKITKRLRLIGGTLYGEWTIESFVND